MSDSLDQGYIAAKMENLERDISELKVGQKELANDFKQKIESMEAKFDNRLKNLEKPLADASVGFRFVRWLGLLVAAIVALKHGDSSLLKSLF